MILHISLLWSLVVNNRNGQGVLYQGKFMLFPDTHSEAYFGIMATDVQENWAQEPTVWTFSRKKVNVLFENIRKGVPVLFIHSLCIRTNTNNLLFPWSINGLLWLIEYFDKMTYIIHSRWIANVYNIEKIITSSFTWQCSWTWFKFYFRGLVRFLKRQFRILQFLRSLLAHLLKKYLLKVIACQKESKYWGCEP